MAKMTIKGRTTDKKKHKLEGFPGKPPVKATDKKPMK